VEGCFFKVEVDSVGVYCAWDGVDLDCCVVVVCPYYSVDVSYGWFCASGCVGVGVFGVDGVADLSGYFCEDLFVGHFRFLWVWMFCIRGCLEF